MSPIGVEVRTRTAPAGRGAFSLTDTLFVAATLTAGPIDKPYLIRSIADLEAVFGITRTSNTVAWDYLDVFFREGGRRAYVIRYSAGAGNLATALALASVDYGPGQVVAPNETPNATNYGVLADHAANNNRVALLDVANNDTVAAMTTLGTTLEGVTNKEYAAAFGPWVNVPAPAGVVGGSARTVHATAVVAGLIARADALGNPNRAAAGRDFPLQYATGFVRDIGATDRDALLGTGGVNTFATRFGVLQLYGFQTAVDQADTTPFWQFNTVRARMWLKARAFEVGEPFMFKPLDARGRLAAALQAELSALCLSLYQVDGLYGETPEDAFSIEVGAAINNAAQASQGVLNAIVEVRLSLHAKRILIDLVTVPVTGVVSQAQ